MLLPLACSSPWFALRSQTAQGHLSRHRALYLVLGLPIVTSNKRVRNCHRCAQRPACWRWLINLQFPDESSLCQADKTEQLNELVSGAKRAAVGVDTREHQTETAELFLLPMLSSVCDLPGGRRLGTKCHPSLF